MKHDRISIDPNVMVGKPVVRGTRVTVEQILREIANGMTVDGVADQYPSLTLDDVRAAVEYAADSLPGPAVAAE